MILSSKYSIKRHIRETHINCSTSSYKVIKRQALEINKSFFEIKSEVFIHSNKVEPSDSSLDLIEPLKQAKEVFLAKYSKKEEKYLEKLSSFKLDSKEKLSPSQIKT
jgi:hypothetical protein